jgi:hypothetical protein
MKLAKRIIAAFLLVLTLSFVGLAGDQQTPGYCPPPPPQLVLKDAGTTSDAQTQNQNTPSLPDESSDSLLFEALTMLLSAF